MNSRTKSPVYCDPDPGRARHESERVTFLIGERVRAKARAALFRDIGVISLIQYLRSSLVKRIKKKKVGFSPCSFFFSYRAERGRQLKLLESSLRSFLLFR